MNPIKNQWELVKRRVSTDVTIVTFFKFIDLYYIHLSINCDTDELAVHLSAEIKRLHQSRYPFASSTSPSSCSFTSSHFGGSSTATPSDPRGASLSASVQSVVASMSTGSVGEGGTGCCETSRRKELPMFTLKQVDSLRVSVILFFLFLNFISLKNSPAFWKN